MKNVFFIFFTCISCSFFAQVVDQDGYTYKTVQIGNQEWFAENLRTSKYNDGTPIPNIIDKNTWSDLNTGAYCFYDNNEANNVTYGKLYNWYSVETEKLCPTGWHVPTDAEWTALSDFLGGKREADEKMKSTTGWYKFGNGTNSSGFNGLPGGYHDRSGFIGVGADGDWWSSTEVRKNLARVQNLNYFVGFTGSFKVHKVLGVSVRCLRD